MFVFCSTCMCRDDDDDYDDDDDDEDDVLGVWKVKETR